MENNVVSVMLWGKKSESSIGTEKSKKPSSTIIRTSSKKSEIAPLTASVKGSTAKGMPILGNREKDLSRSSHRSWQIHCLTGGVTWSSTNGRHKTISPSANSHPVDKLSFIGKPWEWEPLSSFSHTWIGILFYSQIEFIPTGTPYL